MKYKKTNQLTIIYWILILLTLITGSSIMAYYETFEITPSFDIDAFHNDYLNIARLISVVFVFIFSFHLSRHAITLYKGHKYRTPLVILWVILGILNPWLFTIPSVFMARQLKNIEL